MTGMSGIAGLSGADPGEHCIVVISVVLPPCVRGVGGRTRTTDTTGGDAAMSSGGDRMIDTMCVAAPVRAGERDR
jgi:hypothetical protein